MSEAEVAQMRLNEIANLAMTTSEQARALATSTATLAEAVSRLCEAFDDVAALADRAMSSEPPETGDDGVRPF